MVASAHILKVKLADSGSVGGLAGYYASGTSTEYYANGMERPGQWIGLGAESLGLSGEVTKKQLCNLFMGKSPDGSKQLVKVRIPQPDESGTLANKDVESATSLRKRKPPEFHVPGYDITFSPPKSVSALWACADPAVRRVIEEAFQESVCESLKLLEDKLKFARRGKGGKRQEEAGLVIAMFDHTTARNSLDPLLHRHCVVMNLCQGLRDQKWSKVNSQVLLRWVRTIGPLCRNTLCTKLADRLGIEAYRPIVDGQPAGWFEIRGIAEKLTDKWSSRRKEILAESELSNGKCSTAKARQNANLRTRRPKGVRPNNRELHQTWQAIAHELGQTPESLRTVVGRRTDLNVEQRVETAISHATADCLKDRSYFSRHKFFQQVSEELQDVPITGVEVWKRADAALQRLDQFRSLKVQQSQEPIYTTAAVWKAEQRMLQTMDALIQKKGAVVSEKQISKVLKSHPDLIAEQSAAVKYLLESKGALKCLTGIAGSGKTRTLNAVKEAYEAAGYRVLGTALSGVAKEELAVKAGIETRTVDSYVKQLTKPLSEKLYERAKHEITMLCRAALGKRTYQKNSHPSLNQRTVLIVDEAGMVDSRRMELLLRTAKKTGATIIAVGDDKQLNPIGPGGPFKRIIESAPTFHLSENLRQRHAPEDALAAAELRAGNVDKMLESYLRRGRLTVSKTRAEAAQQLVTEWAKDGGAKHPEQAIILTQMRAEAKDINRLCQMERLLEGQISRHSVRIHGETYHVGDRVMFHEGKRRKGIENGYQATVKSIHPVTKAITFKLDRAPSEQQQRFGHTQLVTLSRKEISSEFLTLGYAATTHKLQGQDRPKAYCLIGGRLTDQELTYVQITRGQLSTKLFTDRHHAGQKLSDLAESIQKSGKKKLAHDLGLRLKIEGDNKE